MVCNSTIPEKYTSQEYTQIVQFLMSHPVYPALSNEASTLNYVMAMEFWYTASYNEENRSFEGYVMVNNVATLIRFDVTDFRRVLGLQVMEEYEEEVQEEEALAYMKEAMQYDSSQGDRKYMAVCVQGVWKYLFYTVTKCLGCKTGSMDQMNDMEVQVLYSLVHGKNLDYAQMLFNILKAKVMEVPEVPLFYIHDTFA